MGYGLSEFELLDYVATKTMSGIDEKSETTPRHFILLPYYKDEKNLRDIHQLYYTRLGIKILPYRKDEKGYEQLYHVIKYWNDQIIRRTNNVPKTLDQIDKFVDEL